MISANALYGRRPTDLPRVCVCGHFLDDHDLGVREAISDDGRPTSDIYRSRCKTPGCGARRRGRIPSSVFRPRVVPIKREPCEVYRDREEWEAYDDAIAGGPA